MMVAVTALPEAHELVEGVINVRGRTVPVINLARRLELREPPYDLGTRMVLVSLGDRSMAIPVDEVQGVTDVPESSISLPSNLGRHSELLNGIAEMGEEQLLILDPTALFTDEILFRFPEWEEVLSEEASNGSPASAAPVSAPTSSAEAEE